MTELTISTVESMRSGEKFQIFYETFLKKEKQRDYIEERYKKRVNPYYPSSIVERYRQTCHEIIDFFLSAMKEGFQRPTFEIYVVLENIFVNFINNGIEYKEGTQILKEIYEGDVHVDPFLVELSLVKQLTKGDKTNDLENIKKFLVNFPEVKNLLQNV